MSDNSRVRSSAECQPRLRCSSSTKGLRHVNNVVHASAGISSLRDQFWDSLTGTHERYPRQPHSVRLKGMGEQLMPKNVRDVAVSVTQIDGLLITPAWAEGDGWPRKFEDATRTRNAA
jgi:hypothetical protein